MCQKINQQVFTIRYNECTILKEKDCQSFSARNRLILRLALRVTFDPKSIEKGYPLWDNRVRKFTDLMSHQEKIDPKKERQLSDCCHILIKLFHKLLKVKLTFEYLWRLVCILEINVMTVGDGNYLVTLKKCLI